ncbi:MAG: PmoA family protein [Phycisphaerae bacterium]|nr:PmoA family protein [Phycisphaerae bacterium]
MKLFTVLAYLIFFGFAAAVPAATITVEAGGVERVDTPVWVALDAIGVTAESQNVGLVEITAEGRQRVASQVDANAGRLCWILTGKTAADGKRTYEVVTRRGRGRGRGGVEIVQDDKVLDVQVGQTKVLRFNHAIVPPPAGKSALYNRGGFIHPLWSPAGAELTNIHPADHIHHMGLWMPWTQTRFEGRNIDFWNIADGKGTVRFVKFAGTTEGPVFGGFRSIQEHVDLKAPGGEKVALNEEWDVRVWNTGGADKGFWVVDFVSTQECASSSPLELPAYRYGGFGFRATAEWKQGVANYLTNEGKTRKDGHGTRARWCIAYGATSKGDNGIVFMSHPSNHEFPEPMRLWPSGDIFFNWCPIQEKDWVLEPGKKYVFNYRMYVYDGKMTAEQAERCWQDFGNPPAISIRN